MNARFWTTWNGDWVKLTLTPGQILTAYFKEFDEEGYTEELQTWRYQNNRVEREIQTAGRDCDGYVQGGNVQFSELSDLDAVPAYKGQGGTWPDTFDLWEDFNRPDWRSGESWQRDHSAEAAGY